MRDIKAKRTKAKRWRRKRAHLRLRNRIQGTAERPRLAVKKSLRHIYAQLIDDDRGHTLAQASTLDPTVKERLEEAGENGILSPASLAAAKVVGTTLAERAKEQGVERVVFDRGGFIYHGKIKQVADAAREQGLKF